MHLDAVRIVEYTGGTLVEGSNAAAVATSVTWDSREVVPGSLYVALVGARVDGHTFCQAALDDGATVLLVSHALPRSVVDAAMQCGAAIIAVPDSEQAFTALAAGWRTHLQGTVIGLTGSSGKTTTKNLLRDVLSAHGSCVATKANQNNELGVPRTVLNADADTAAVVVEMGMRGLGQIAELCDFVKPSIGVITNVGECHMELLGSRENIARAKGELIASLPEGGCAVLNARDAYTDFICEDTQAVSRVVSVLLYDGSGTPDLRATVFATDVTFDDRSMPSFVLHTPSGSHPCTLQVAGAHNVQNACAVATVAHVLGMSVEAIAAALGTAVPEAGRQRMLATAGGVTVVDDAYNANPDSMTASLSTFATLRGKRHIAVLGDMGELGPISVEAHERIGRLAATLGSTSEGAADLDLLLCIGGLSRSMARAAKESGMVEDAVLEFDSVEQARAYVIATVREGDAVLVKASHSMGLEKIVEGLMQGC